MVMNISIREEAYAFLKSLKAGNRSFSDVILGFKEQAQGSADIMRFFGVLQDVDWEERKKEMVGLRREFEERL